MPLERRNEPFMLRQFHKMYPSYNINPLLRRRHQQLVEAQAFLLCTRTAQSRTASAKSEQGVTPAIRMMAMCYRISG